LFADDVLPGGAAGMMEEQLCTDEVKKKQDSEGGGGGISLFHGEQPPSPYELSRTTKEERSPCLL
jgi:hypothetical protein